MSSAFSSVISYLRQTHGFSQRKVSGDLGISQALLSHYENGLREPRLEFVVRICDYYGVTADYILGRTKIPDNPDNLQELVKDLRAITARAEKALQNSEIGSEHLYD